MTSIKLMIIGAQAWASVNGPLTSGMVGIPVTIEYDEAWDGLTKNLMCRCSPWGSDDGEVRTILNVGETAVVAHEVMQAGMYLYLGVEGFRDDGKLVIPTTWAKCGKIEHGANTGNDPSTDPELSVWNQLQIEMEQTKKYVLTPEQATNIQAYAQEARQAAEEAKQAAENGLYYTPTVSQPTGNTLKFEFKPSVTGAPVPKPVTVELPVGEDPGQNVNPVAKTEDMTQPVGVDEAGRLWTAPTADNAGNDEESADVLLGTLPMTISESNCYLLSDTNATISTGEGATQLVDFNANPPYIGDATYNGGAVEVLGEATVRVSFANVAKNASVFFDAPLEIGKTYTIATRLVGKSDDITGITSLPIIRVAWELDDEMQAAQVSTPESGEFAFKTINWVDGASIYIALSKKTGYVVGETYATVEVRIYEGEHTELPAGATFDILAGEKYPTDGYMGATLSAVSGGPVRVYQTNTAGAEGETDNGGVIFFGDSILHYSDVVSRYAAKTGKPILSCAVGGTRMSASRDSSNPYYPVDMANIANAIASGDFTAQLNSGVATAGFTTLASANIANYKAIILEFGTNDFSAKVPFNGEDSGSIKGAIKHILRTILSKYPNMRIVVLSTLQYVTIGTGTESGVPTHDDGTVWQMNEVIKGVCESDEFCVPWVDMYHAFGQNGITRNTLNSDGVHLTSPNGAKRYADILVSKLNALGI